MTMDNDTTKALQFLISNLCQQIEFSALRNRAYEKLAPQLADQVSSLLTTPEFDALIQQSSEIRRQVIEALANEDWPAIFGGLGALIGSLAPR
jgi:ABC-type antimicrobial peptide transport system permease subunit